jgi:hypothetical protein
MSDCYAQSIQKMKKCEYLSHRFDAVIVKKVTSLYPVGHTFIEVGAEDVDRSKFKVGKYTYRLLMNEFDSLARWQGREQACNYVGEEEITKAEALVRKQVRNQRVLLEKGKMHPAWGAMETVFKRIVNRYHDDFLWHDTRILGMFNPTKFVWCVRDCGTQVFLVSGSIDSARYYADNRNGDKSVEFYVWTGSVFYQIPAKEVASTVTNWLPEEIEEVK